MNEVFKSMIEEHFHQSIFDSLQREIMDNYNDYDLTFTGVRSGSLAASLLDMRFKWAFPAILVGNIVAAGIIMGLSNEAFKLLG